MGVNGKQKGNSYERKIANLFSDRFKDYTGVAKGFRRNPDSGSFFGGSNAARTETHNTDYAVYGDLICPRNFLFSIECKHYKNAPPLNAIITQKVSDWDLWLKQNKADATLSQRKALLVVKYNRTETIVFVENELKDKDYIFNYKGNFVYPLPVLLEMKDKYFFEEDIK